MTTARRRKSEPPRTKRPPGASIIGSDDGWGRPALAGVAGGIVALILLIVLQAIGLVPSPGRSTAVQAADQAKTASEAVAALDRRVSAIEMITQNLPSKSTVEGLGGQVAQLQKEMGALATQGDLTVLEDKLSALTKRVDALPPGATHDELAALADRVARLEAGGAAGGGGGADASAVTALNSRIDQAQASLKALGERMAALEGKLAAGPADSTLAARAIAVVALSRAVDEGAPFTTDLDLAAALGLPAADVAELRPFAEKGVATKAALAARFGQVGDAIIAATTNANPNAGFFERLMASIGSLVTVRPTGPVEGNDPAAIVSRMQAAVDAGDLAHGAQRTRQPAGGRTGGFPGLGGGGQKPRHRRRADRQDRAIHRTGRRERTDMIRVLLYIVVVFLAAAGFVWLAERPGELLVNWQGYEIRTSVMVAVVGAAIALALIAIVGALLRAVVRTPQTVGNFFGGRRRDRGYRALSRGMIAVGAGDTRAAQRAARESQSLLGRSEPLVLLLSAQAAQIAGDGNSARSAFTALSETAETRVLGLHGLFVEARRTGEHAAARHFAEEAIRISPRVAWAGTALFDYQCQAGDWEGALKTLATNADAGAIDRDRAQRLRAVLMTGRAIELEAGQPDEARDVGDGGASPGTRSGAGVGDGGAAPDPQRRCPARLAHSGNGVEGLAASRCRRGLCGGEERRFGARPPEARAQAGGHARQPWRGRHGGRPRGDRRPRLAGGARGAGRHGAARSRAKASAC